MAMKIHLMVDVTIFQIQDGRRLFDGDTHRTNNEFADITDIFFSDTPQTQTRARLIEYFVKGFDTHLNYFAHTLKNEQHTLKNNSNKSKAETKLKSKLVFLARHMKHTNTNTFD